MSQVTDAFIRVNVGARGVGGGGMVDVEEAAAAWEREVMADGDRASELLGEIEREFPGFRVVRKNDSVLSRVIDAALKVLTLGAQRRYLTAYHTVIGRTLYVPAGWDERPWQDRFITLRHERVHLRQFRRLTRPGMALVYLLPYLPIGLAWGRARLEWEAYAETLRATAEVHGLEAARDERLIGRIVRQFTSGAYGWMWPFPRAVRRWIDDEIARITGPVSPT